MLFFLSFRMYLIRVGRCSSCCCNVLLVKREVRDSFGSTQQFVSFFVIVRSYTLYLIFFLHGQPPGVCRFRNKSKQALIVTL